MKPILLKDLYDFELFRFKPDSSSPVYIRNYYDRISNRISFSPYDDYDKERFHNPNLTVYVD